MTIFLRIIISLWLAQTLFQILRTLVLIAYELGCDPRQTAPPKHRAIRTLPLDFTRRLYTMYHTYVDSGRPGSSVGANPAVL